MKKYFINFLKRPEIIFMILITFFRIYVSHLIGAWYPSDQLYDDNLLISYADLSNHFTTPNSYSLVKTMSYPIFLNFVHLTKLSYTIVLSLIWVIAAILCRNVFKKITRNRFLLTFIYLFVLFTPSAFDGWSGTRLYRNSIIAPFVYITFAIMLHIVIKLVMSKKFPCRYNLFSTIILGNIFSFTYYIKEDGIWLLPCLILTILVSIIIVIFKYKREINKRLKKRIFGVLISLCLPLVIFFVNTNIYKFINYHYFGVYEINTRTEGELGKFTSNIYKIYSDNRTPFVWAPYDAIENAFNVSETLKNYPNLKENIINTPWFKDGDKQNPIKGDFLTWVLRSSLIDTNTWNSEKQVNDLFYQVNVELKNAFKSGMLQKDNKIQISNSAGGRSLKEIFQIKDEFIGSYKSVIFLDGYMKSNQIGSYADIESCAIATKLTNMNFMPLTENETKVRETQSALGENIVSIIFKVYKFLNPFLFILSLIIMIIGIINVFRKAFNKNVKYSPPLIASTFIMIVLFGISILYALGIGWFSGFIWGNNGINTVILQFYSVGLVPILSLFELFGLFLFDENIKKVLPI